MFDKNIINKFKKIKTPFYYYDLKVLEDTLTELKKQSDKYSYTVHYAIKANANERILTLISSYGFGADCVSGNEITKSIRTGFDKNKIVFAGVGKSDDEIMCGLKNDIFCFNVESIQELEVINALAASVNKTARVALRINPNVDAKTHQFITTGLEENKFGINGWEFEDVIKKLKELKHIETIGLHFHIGSQITDLNVFKGLCIRANEIQSWFNDHGLEFEHINVGGGLGVNYKEPDENLIPDFNSFFSVFNKFLELRGNQTLHFELGRTLVAQCGSLISKVLFVKEGVNTSFAILDAGMTELLRPALYQSYHKIENLTSEGDVQNYDVVGPICESSDTFGKSVKLPETKRGDLIAIRSTGAYGEVMSFGYNLRDKAAVYYSDEFS